MIEGLHVTVSGTELAGIISVRVSDLRARAGKLAKFREQTETLRDEININSNVSKVDPEQAIGQLREEATELEFLAAHLVPTETYQLDHDDLRRIGVVKGYR